MTHHNPAMIQRLLLALALIFSFTLIGCLSAEGTEDDTQDSKAEITSITTHGSPVQPGGQIQVDVETKVPGGETPDYEWDIPEAWQAEDMGERTLVLTAPEKKAASGTVSVSLGNEANASSASVEVATDGPVIENLSVTPSSEEPGRISVEVDAYNHKGSPLDYHYEVDGIHFEDQESKWDWSTIMAGDYRVHAIVEDNEGLTASASADVTLEDLSPWPSFGGGVHGRAQTRTTTAQEPVSVEKWEGPAELSEEFGQSFGMAIGPQGTLYVGGQDNYLYAFNPEDGSKEWRFETEGPVEAVPVVDPDGNIYFGSDDGYIYALKPDGESLKWRHETGDSVFSSPSIGDDGTVYVGSADHHLYALDPEDGNKKWRYETEEEVVASPALDGQGTVYVGSTDNYLYALDAETGELQWRFETGDAIGSSPTVGPEGIVYFGSADGNLYALDTADGSKVWQYETEQLILASPALSADGTIYVGSFDEYLYALDALDGSKKWGVKNKAGISSASIGADGTIYVGSITEGFLALNPEDGTPVREYNTGPAVAMSPAIGDDGTVYLASSNSEGEETRIHAFH